MGGMFKGPKPPKQQPVVPPPTIDEAEARRIEQDRLRKRRGRMSTIMSEGGSLGGSSVGISRLLGGA